MKWTELIRPGTLGAFALAASAMLVGNPAAVSAQISECRCVDRDGNETENCSCFRTFEGDRGFGSMFFERRSQIGVSISFEQDRDIEARGALIEDVSDGPAREGGLREGDIVVRVDGQSVLDPLEDRDREAALDLEQSIPVQRFVALVGDLEPGEEVEFEVIRDGATRTVVITPERYRGFQFLSSGDGGWTIMGDEGRAILNLDRNDMLRDMRRLEEEMTDRARNGIIWGRGDGDARVFEFRNDGEWQRDLERSMGERPTLRLFGDSGSRAFAFSGDPCVVRRDSGENTIEVMVGWTGCTDGVEFTEMNEGLAGYFGTADGVLVTEVHEGSALGLQAGDVLLAIDGRTVADTDDVTRILRSYDLDEELTLRIRRENREMEILGQRRDDGGEG